MEHKHRFQVGDSIVIKRTGKYDSVIEVRITYDKQYMCILQSNSNYGYYEDSLESIEVYESPLYRVLNGKD